MRTSSWGMIPNRIFKGVQVVNVVYSPLIQVFTFEKDCGNNLVKVRVFR